MSLTRPGVIINYNELITKVGQMGFRKIKRVFSIKTPAYNNTFKTISCYKIFKKGKEKYLLLPRFAGLMLSDTGIIGPIINRLHVGEDRKFVMCAKLTPNQSVVVAFLLQGVYNKQNEILGRSSCILQMDPGYGKTYLAIALIEFLKKKTFIIVPNTYLLKQWISTLEITFPNHKIGCYYGSKKEDGDVIVSIVNSALKYPEYNKIGFIIYDEVHMYCSQKFSKIFNKAQSKFCIGLTATPGERIDKFDPVAEWALGKVIYSNKLKNWNASATLFTTEVTRVIFNGHTDYTHIIEAVNGIVSVPLMLNQIQDDPYRNRLIVAYAVKLYKMKRHVFVFSDRREHLHKLAHLLKEYKIIYKAPELDPLEQKIKGVQELMGGSTEEDIKQAQLVGKIIMTTYQYTGTGVSINKMDSLILATPRKSNMKQILGRIYRLKGDSTIKRHIIDIVDNKICLKSQYYTRKKTYINTLQSVISDQKIKWDDCKTVDGIIKIINK
jgi:superfamily II DNA or RNA helicase